MPQIDACPSCGGTLEIRELECRSCDITIRGHFPMTARGPFSRLSSDQLAFLHLFVTSRGNLSDVERSLGVSYPTVRAKLDDLIAALSADEPARSPESPPLSRQEVFDRVSRGEISVDEAMAILDTVSTSGE
ncbi:MAG: DUF2089 domain-containing protein [Chloroflexota bacterium]